MEIPKNGRTLIYRRVFSPSKIFNSPVEYFAHDFLLFALILFFCSNSQRMNDCVGCEIFWRCVVVVVAVLCVCVFPSAFDQPPFSQRTNLSADPFSEGNKSDVKIFFLAHLTVCVCICMYVCVSLVRVDVSKRRVPFNSQLFSFCFCFLIRCWSQIV